MTAGRPPVPASPLAVWVALVTVYLVWGSTYLGIRVVVETVPPLLAMGARFLTAGLLLGAFLVVRRGRRALSVTRRQLGGAAVVGLLLLLCGNGSRWPSRQCRRASRRCWWPRRRCGSSCCAGCRVTGWPA